MRNAWKRMIGVTVSGLLLLGASASAQTSSASQSSGQSLGDAARGAQEQASVGHRDAALRQR